MLQVRFFLIGSILQLFNLTHETLSFFFLHKTHVADPWGGSYMMESLTNQLAKEAMVQSNSILLSISQ